MTGQRRRKNDATMPDADRDARSKESVGYRNPPVATRFSKGKSGNPKGRPKGSKSVGAILREVMQQRISVTENGVTRRIPRIEVILRRLANDALRSGPAAVKLTMSLFERYAESSSSEAPGSLAVLLEEDRAFFMRWAPKMNQNDTDGGAASTADPDVPPKSEAGDEDDEL